MWFDLIWKLQKNKINYSATHHQNVNLVQCNITIFLFYFFAVSVVWYIRIVDLTRRCKLLAFAFHICCFVIVNISGIYLWCLSIILGPKNFQIGSADPGHAHLGVLFRFIHRNDPSSIYVSNMKRIAQFVQKLLRGPKIWKLGHVTLATPT